jgi:hypothetical protein
MNWKRSCLPGNIHDLIKRNLRSWMLFPGDSKDLFHMKIGLLLRPQERERTYWPQDPIFVPQLLSFFHFFSFDRLPPHKHSLNKSGRKLTIKWKWKNDLAAVEHYFLHEGFFRNHLGPNQAIIKENKNKIAWLVMSQIIVSVEASSWAKGNSIWKENDWPS